MPKVVRCTNAYLCVAWHIRSKLGGRVNRRLDCVIPLSGQAEVADLARPFGTLFPHGKGQGPDRRHPLHPGHHLAPAS